MLPQNTMVSGLEIVNIKQVVKLFKGVHAIEPAGPVLPLNEDVVYKIIRPNRISMIELTIPKSVFIFSF